MHILLLHGALGAETQYRPLAERLKSFATPHTMNFAGHGGTEVPSDPFRISGFARQVLAWMDEHKHRTINFIGYSMGGYVALYIARHHPERVGKIFTISTKFLWSPEIAEREKKNLDPEMIAAKAPEFGRALAERHGETNWKNLLEKTGQMIIDIAADTPLKPADYAAITQPALVSVGDSDKMVSLEETIDVFRLLGNATFLVLPSTPHPLEAIDPDVLAFHAKRFFEG